MKNREILHAYRNLYRTALQATHYAKPARYQLRDILREAFRSETAESFNPRRIQNTLRFIENSRVHNGFEHKIIKNLLYVRWFRTVKGLDRKMFKQSNHDYAIRTRKQIWLQYHATLTMLNESLDICLSCGTV